MTALRPATSADLPLLLSLIRSLAEYEHLLPECTADLAGLRRDLFPDGGAPAAAHVVLAEEAGVPVGFALYFFNYSTFLAKPGLYLEDLYVYPEHRGRGHGKALLLHLARLAYARGCGRMEWTVLDWNQPAIAFYEKIGARRMREWQLCRLTAPALASLASL